VEPSGDGEVAERLGQEGRRLAAPVADPRPEIGGRLGCFGRRLQLMAHVQGVGPSVDETGPVLVREMVSDGQNPSVVGCCLPVGAQL
jgi:hypothetical protein